MRRIYKFLISLWTLQGMLALAVGVCLVGSLVLPANLALFSGIDDTPLFSWLKGSGSPLQTWWLYALIAALALLALSTSLCTADALTRIRGGNFMHKLYPQLIHMGVLLVMLGHLLTAWLGIRVDLPLHQGQMAAMSKEYELTVTKIGIDGDKKDYYDDWVVELAITGQGGEARHATLRPVSPVFHKGLGLFMKSVTIAKPGSGTPPSTLIRVTHDPGAGWALLGGLLVIAGGIGFWLTRAPRGATGTSPLRTHVRRP